MAAWRGAIGGYASHRTDPTARGPIQRHHRRPGLALAPPGMASSTASWSRYGAVPTSAPPPPAGPEDLAVADGEAAAPSSSSPATAAEAGVAFFSRARAYAGAAAGRPRAWREVLDPTAFSRPDSCWEARARARRNLAYFRANYALAALVLVFLGLVYRPVSMLVFLALFVAWLGLYFGRGEGEPLVCLRREVDDRVVLVVLSAATVLAVALTRAGLNLLVSLVVAAAVIGLHAAFRVNYYLDERDAFDVAGTSFTDSGYGYTLPR
uniref:PRA1 family protein n=2 Tax=Setaria italica TaxID=4555 RepID=K4ADU5_SETIT